MCIRDRVFTHHTLYEQYTHYVFPESKVMKRLAIEIATVYANLCTRVIAPSESIARLIRERGVKKPVEIIPTGVDVHFSRSGDGVSFRKSQGIPEDAFVIGHLGRLAPEKNLQYLAEAVIKAFEELPENTFFLVVGSGPSEKTITDMFKDAGLGNASSWPEKEKDESLPMRTRPWIFSFSLPNQKLKAWSLRKQWLQRSL